MCLHCAKSAMEINGNNVKKRGRGEMKGDKRKEKMKVCSVEMGEMITKDDDDDGDEVMRWLLCWLALFKMTENRGKSGQEGNEATVAEKRGDVEVNSGNGDDVRVLPVQSIIIIISTHNHCQILGDHWSDRCRHHRPVPAA